MLECVDNLSLELESLEYEAFMAATASLQSLMAFSSRIFCDVLTPMTPKTTMHTATTITATMMERRIKFLTWLCTQVSHLARLAIWPFGTDLREPFGRKSPVLLF